MKEKTVQSFSGKKVPYRAENITGTPKNKVNVNGKVKILVLFFFSRSQYQ